MGLTLLSHRTTICLALALLVWEGSFSEAFQNCPFVLTKQTKPLSLTSPDNKIRCKRLIQSLHAYRDKSDKFSFAQRIESTKTGVVGLLAGGIALTPVAAIHDIVFPGDSIPGGAAQWEFDTDMGSIETALFAIVYRYCVREGEETNEMLGMGVVGAFVLVRTLSRVRVSSYCSFAPLDCGAPLGYFDWDMIQQSAFSGLESVVMFGATAAAMEYCYKRRIISRFE